MGKIIRLTESDLTRLVRRVIEEQNTESDAKRIAQQIKDGVSSFGNTNVDDIRDALNVLSVRTMDIKTIKSVYRILGITSLKDYLDDEFIGYQMTKGQKDDPLGKKIYDSMGGKEAHRILSSAEEVDKRYRLGR
jgi:hypothetical protein